MEQKFNVQSARCLPHEIQLWAPTPSSRLNALQRIVEHRHKTTLCRLLPMDGYCLLWIADKRRPREGKLATERRYRWSGLLRRTITRATLATLAPAKKPDFPPVQGHRLFRGRSQMTWSRWSGKFHKPGIGRRQSKYQETSEIENIWQKIPWPEKCNWPIYINRQHTTFIIEMLFWQPSEIISLILE